MSNTVSQDIFLEVKMGSDLQQSEIEQMTAALYREFKIETNPEKFRDKLFFLLKDKSVILAMGGLWEVRPVVFDDVEYTIHGVVEVVANQKGLGYGKRVVAAMRDYMVAKDLTGLGFCARKNKGFYEKCGFTLAEGITQKFIYRHEGKDVTNQDGQIIFYQDGSDEFMKKVLVDSEKEISLPTSNLW